MAAHDVIQVRGAHENNLAHISLDIPKRKLTVFTGVSGSGKSSLVFDTIAAESQRLINETYPVFVQGFMTNLDRPAVDSLDGLTAVIHVDQERMAPNQRSTLGTATDVYTLLRILFSRAGQPYWGPPQAFSFNVPTVSASGMMKVERPEGARAVKKTFTSIGGMCPRCEGIGTVKEIDTAELFDPSKSLEEDPFLIPGYKMGGWNYRLYAESGFFRPQLPLGEYSAKELRDLLYHEPVRMKIAGINQTYEGLVPRLRQSLLAKEPDAMQPSVRAFAERAVTFSECPDCGGSRLTAGARESLIGGKSIADAVAMQISELRDWVASLVIPEVSPLLEELRHTLDAFVTIGLGYLTANRPASTLSGGEAQRTKMVRHLGSALTDVTYIFDEPSIGLHPHDLEQMSQLLLRLRDKGNTVLVVEHKTAIISIADHVVDIGPGAGDFGGTICFEGSVPELRQSDTLTGRHLADRPRLKEAVRAGSGALTVRHATLHNLADVSVSIPLHALTVITGVAGSGKSSLTAELAGQGQGTVSWSGTREEQSVVVVDHSAITGSSRSTLATYTGVADAIRKAFAQENNVKPALFSSNSEGACPHCAGVGTISTSLGIMSTVTTTCGVCEGKRFDSSVLEYRLRGKSIADVLDLPVSAALEFFHKDRKIRTILSRLDDVGLGYIRLGQTLTTLSGGERQRLKLAVALGQPGEIYIIDEPTNGLHLADVDRLLALLDALVDSGKTVIVVEHHQSVMAHADWIIDCGPGAGRDGGAIVFEGDPRTMVADCHTVTARYLAAALG